MLTCNQCVENGFAYKVLHDMVLCPVAQTSMCVTQSCTYSLQDLARKRKEARHRADRLDALCQAAAWINAEANAKKEEEV